MIKVKKTENLRKRSQGDFASSTHSCLDYINQLVIEIF